MYSVNNEKIFTEPNVAIFTHNGLTCVVLRMPHSGTLNGYVGLPETHELYREHYTDGQMYFDVHGGVTYSDMGLHNIEIFDNLWFIGFDTNHSCDKAPIMPESMGITRDGTYKDFDYVKKETIKLADQLNNC